MTLTLLVVTIAAFVVLFTCTTLAFHPKYHSGFIGTLGMGMLAVGAMSRLTAIFERVENHAALSDQLRITPLGLLIWVGLALHFSWLTYKFFWRVKTGHNWYEDPDSAKQHRERRVAG